MMAAALAPHNGVVIWRAFVYDMRPGYDRAGAAFENLQPFDAKFAANALLQVKNGPIDFQPREPFHPLIGAMPKTQMMPEFQITQEYLGFSNHLVFLAQMWREVLDRGVRDGAFRADLDTSLIYRFIRDTVWTAAGWFQPGGRLPADEIAKQYLAMVLEGIQAQSQGVPDAP